MLFGKVTTLEVQFYVYWYSCIQSINQSNLPVLPVLGLLSRVLGLGLPRCKWGLFARLHGVWTAILLKLIECAIGRPKKSSLMELWPVRKRRLRLIKGVIRQKGQPDKSS